MKKVLLINIVLLGLAGSVAMAESVETGDAMGVTLESAVLHGNADIGSPTFKYNVYFQWGTDSSFGNQTALTQITSDRPFSHTLTNLRPETTYH